MNALTTVSFDPTRDDQQEVVDRVARVFDLAHSRTGCEQEPGGGDSGARWWTSEKVEVYVAALKPVARTVLGVIVRSAPCPAEAAQYESGLGSRRYAEAQESLKSALSAVSGIDGPPFDFIDDCYEFDAEMAGWVSSSLSRLENRTE